MTAVSLSNPLIRSDLGRIPLNLGLIEALSDQHLLLTGATGFFGRWLLVILTKLNQHGASIKVTAVSRDPEAFLALHPEYRACTWLSWLCSDVRDLTTVPDGPVTLILHAATDTSASAHARPLDLFETIIEGARRIYDLAVRNGGARVLVTGSGAQYGHLDFGFPVTENCFGACISNAASSIYGESKRIQETLGSLYAHYHDVPVVMARCFAFSGPGLLLDGHFAIGNFIRDALWSDALVLNSTGTAVRSYLHVADLAAWLLVLLVRGEKGMAYNVGSDQAITIKELACRVANRLAPHKKVYVFGDSTPSERSYYVPNIDRARAMGLDIWTTLDQSIDSMGAWAMGSSRKSI